MRNSAGGRARTERMQTVIQVNMSKYDRHSNKITLKKSVSFTKFVFCARASVRVLGNVGKRCLSYKLCGWAEPRFDVAHIYSNIKTDVSPQSSGLRAVAGATLRRHPVANSRRSRLQRPLVAAPLPLSGLIYTDKSYH